MTPELFGALATLASRHATGGEMGAARSVAEQLVERGGGEIPATIAAGILGFCQLMQAEIEVGTEKLERSSRLRELPGALDPGIAATSDAALGRCLLGQPSRALDLIRTAARRAAAWKHPATIAHAAFSGIRVRVILLDDPLVEESAATLAALPTQFSVRWLARSEIGLGWLATTTAS